MPRSKGSAGSTCSRVCHKCNESMPQLGFDQKTNLCLSCRPDGYEWALATLVRLERDRRHLAAVLPPRLAAKLKPLL